jgi:multidrug efflux pump subunit AcrA (membrane-fusion protein)
MKLLVGTFSKISKDKPSPKHLYLAVGGFVLIGALAVAYTARRRGVPTVHPKRGPIVEAVYGLGTVVAEHSFEFKVGVVTNVSKVFVREGDHLKQGDPLLRLESNAVIRAPFEGTLSMLQVKDGETVFPQVPVLRLESMKHLYIQVSLEQQGALRIRRGQKANLAFESLRGKRFVGEVKSIYPSQGQFLTAIDVAEFPPEVLPGMTADVAIEVGRKDNAVLVPASALVGGKLVVNRKKIPVEVGTVDGEWAEITSPALNPEDAIVVNPK